MIRAALALSLVALGGCVSVFPDPGPAPRLFVLEADASAAPSGATLDAVISVAAPGGDRAELGDDLVWRSGSEIAYISGVKWSGRAEDLLRALLIETLARQQSFSSVVRAGDARADYELRWDVIDFDAGEDGAHFAAHVNLVNSATRAVVATRIIEVETPISGASQSGAAEALARAAREGGARIAAFAVESVQASAVSISK